MLELERIHIRVDDKPTERYKKRLDRLRPLFPSLDERGLKPPGGDYLPRRERFEVVGSYQTRWGWGKRRNRNFYPIEFTAEYQLPENTFSPDLGPYFIKPTVFPQGQIRTSTGRRAFFKTPRALFNFSATLRVIEYNPKTKSGEFVAGAPIKSPESSEFFVETERTGTRGKNNEDENFRHASITWPHLSFDFDVNNQLIIQLTFGISLRMRGNATVEFGGGSEGSDDRFYDTMGLTLQDFDVQPGAPI